MRFLLLKIYFILSVFVFSQQSFAEAGGGGEAKPAAKKVPEEEDWAKQVNYLNSKEGKVKNYTKELKTLIVDKKITTDTEEKKIIINQIIKVHALLKKEEVSYNNMRRKIRYRFPDKGTILDRKYLPMKIQSIEKMEDESGVDNQLTKLRRKIGKKYKPYLKKELQVKHENGNFEKKKKKKKSGKIIIER